MMTHKVSIDPSILDRARYERFVNHEAATANFLRKLSRDEYMRMDDVRDALHFSTGWPSEHSYEDVVEGLTGSKEQTLMIHPGRGNAACGVEFYPSAVVVYAIVLLRRLGVPAADVAQPLIDRLSDKRANPMLTRFELSVLWSKKEDRAQHVFLWPDVHGDPYTLGYARWLPCGLLLMKGYNADGEMVQVTSHTAGKKAHETALSAGLFVTKSDMRKFSRLRKEVSCES